MAAPHTKPISDLDTLKALAHPLRLRLLGLLRADGPATASGLARRVGESSGATSYHLRQLERFGFVTDAGEQPSRRERVWRARHEVTSWAPGDFLEDEDARMALDAIERNRLAWQQRVSARWVAERASWPRGWVDAALESDRMLRLHPDDLERLKHELQEVVDRCADRPTDDPRAERVLLFLQGFPVKELDL